MFRYVIEFQAQGLDEGALRDALEDLSIYDASVERVRIGRGLQEQTLSRRGDVPASLPRGIPGPHRSVVRRARLLEHFSAPGVVARADIVAGLDPSEADLLQRDLTALTGAGILVRVGHGLYVSSAFPPPTQREIEEFRQRRKARPKGNENEAILSFLKEPQSSQDLRQHLRVTRQAVDQLTKKLLERGLIFRGEVDRSVEGVSYLFCVDKERLERRMEEIASMPSQVALRLLTALPETGACLLSDASVASRVGLPKAQAALANLVTHGLVKEDRLGGSTIIRLTEEGQKHPARLKPGARAASRDLFEVYGETRGVIIELLAVLGRARTRDLTMAVRRLSPQHDGKLGQQMQRMKGEKLVRSVDVASGWPMQELTEEGLRIWRLIAPYRQSPTRSSLTEIIRHEAEKIVARRPREVAWTPGERAIDMLRVMEAMGPSTTGEIVELMEVPFQNPRSINLAVKSLVEAGMASRTGKGTKNDPHRYRATEAGLQALASAQGAGDGAPS